MFGLYLITPAMNMIPVINIPIATADTAISAIVIFILFYPVDPTPEGFAY